MNDVLWAEGQITWVFGGHGKKEEKKIKIVDEN